MYLPLYSSFFVSHFFSSYEDIHKKIQGITQSLPKKVFQWGWENSRKPCPSVCSTWRDKSNGRLLVCTVLGNLLEGVLLKVNKKDPGVALMVSVRNSFWGPIMISESEIKSNLNRFEMLLCATRSTRLETLTGQTQPFSQSDFLTKRLSLQCNVPFS